MKQNRRRAMKLLSGVLSLAMVCTAAWTVSLAADGDVAAVDGTTYATVSQAIANGNGKTVTLLKDITESITIPNGSTITLNLGGFTLTNQAGAHTITNQGKLTLTGSGTVDNVSNGKGALVNQSGGQVTINGGTLTRSKEAGVKGNNGGNSWYVVDNQGTMTITDGTVRNTSGYSSLIRNLKGTLHISGGTFSNGFIAIKNDDNGKLTVTGGTISTTAAGGSAVQNWGEAAISGGTLNAPAKAAAVYTSSWDPQFTAPVTQIQDGAVINGDVQVIIDVKNKKQGAENPKFVMTGGQVKGNIRALDSADIALKGGTVTGKLTKEKEDASLLVSGGTYSQNPAEFLAADSTAVGYTKHNADAPVYFTGTPAQVVKSLGALASGDKLEILKGDLALTIDQDQVSVINHGDGQVTVNEQSLAKGDQPLVTHVHQAVYIAPKEPTATEAGNIGYWYCEGCQKYFSDEALTQEIAFADTVIPATGQLLPPPGGEQPAPAPQEQQNADNPKTGDLAPLYLLALGLLTAAGATSYLIYKKKTA